MDPVAVIGYVAGAFTTVAFLPQLVRALWTKSMADLSSPMLAMMFSGSRSGASTDTLSARSRSSCRTRSWPP